MPYTIVSPQPSGVIESVPSESKGLVQPVETISGTLVEKPEAPRAEISGVPPPTGSLVVAAPG